LGAFSDPVFILRKCIKCFKIVSGGWDYCKIVSGRITSYWGRMRLFQNCIREDYEPRGKDNFVCGGGYVTAAFVQKGELEKGYGRGV
jgi:hypothetical protein